MFILTIETLGTLETFNFTSIRKMHAKIVEILSEVSITFDPGAFIKSRAFSTRLQFLRKDEFIVIQYQKSIIKVYKMEYDQLQLSCLYPKINKTGFPVPCRKCTECKKLTKV